MPEVRLIGPNGEQVGVVAIGIANAQAEAAELDLVEIAPTAVMLASDEGSYYIGASLNPNGGDMMI